LILFLWPSAGSLYIFYCQVFAYGSYPSIKSIRYTLLAISSCVLMFSSIKEFYSLLVDPFYNIARGQRMITSSSSGRNTTSASQRETYHIEIQAQATPRNSLIAIFCWYAHMCLGIWGSLHSVATGWNYVLMWFSSLWLYFSEVVVSSYISKDKMNVFSYLDTKFMQSLWWHIFLVFKIKWIFFLPRY